MRVSERGKRDEKGRGPKGKENVDHFRGSYDPGVSQCIDVWQKVSFMLQVRRE
jgi:hypothetical protein